MNRFATYFATVTLAVAAFGCGDKSTSASAPASAAPNSAASGAVAPTASVAVSAAAAPAALPPPSGKPLFESTWAGARAEVERGADGRMYVFGNFKNKLEVAGKILTAGNEAAQGFIMRIDDQGKAAVVTHVRSDKYQSVSDLAVAKDGSIAVVGAFTDKAKFNGGEVVNENKNTDSVGYVALLDKTGKHQWSMAMPDLKVTNQVIKATGGYDGVAFDAKGGVWAVGGGGQRPAMRLLHVSKSGDSLLNKEFKAPGVFGESWFSNVLVGKDGHAVASGTFKKSIDLGLGALQGGNIHADVMVRFDDAGKAVSNTQFGDGKVGQGIHGLSQLDDGFIFAGSVQPGATKLPNGEKVAFSDKRSGYVMSLDAKGKPGWYLRWQTAHGVVASGPGGVSVALVVCAEVKVLPDGPTLKPKKSGCNSVVLRYSNKGKLLWQRDLDVIVNGLAIGPRGETYYFANENGFKSVTVGALAN